MVTKRSAQQSLPLEDVPERELTSSVRLAEVLNAGLRLEASTFNIEARKIVEELKASGLPLTALFGDSGLCQRAHNAFRFKRIWVDKNHGFPFLSSSDIISMRPRPKGYLSNKLTPRKSELIVSSWDVLISRSGTVGNIGLATARLADQAVSEDVIRLSANSPEDAGFIVAFLRGRFGRLQFNLTAYGSVVRHIEPEHLTHVLIPALPPIRRAEIGRKIIQAYEWRDEANALLDEADTLIHKRLDLPKLPSLAAEDPAVREIRASTLDGRFEASFHGPRVAEAESRLAASGLELKRLGDSDVSAEIRAVTKFRKRVYVETGGIPLLSSKQLFQIAPIDQKAIARGAHLSDMKEIDVHENMIAVTCSGTIGKIQIIPKYMEGWAASQDAIRMLVSEKRNTGYIFAWLSSDYGQVLIKRLSYGSVVIHIDKEMLASVLIPIPTPEIEKEIGDRVLEANKLRSEAWKLEQQAIKQLEKLIQKKRSIYVSVAPQIR